MLGPGSYGFASAWHGALQRLLPSWPPGWADAEELLGARCREQTASGGGGGGSFNSSPQQDIPSPSASLPQTPPRGSFYLKPGRKMVYRASWQQRILRKSLGVGVGVGAHCRGEGIGFRRSSREGTKAFLLQDRETTTYLSIPPPPTHSKSHSPPLPPGKVSEARKGFIAPWGLVVKPAPASSSMPLPASLKLCAEGGHRGSGCSSDSLGSAPTLARSSPPVLLPRGLFPLCLSLRLPSLLTYFLFCCSFSLYPDGEGWKSWPTAQTWQALGSLVPHSVWVRRPKPQGRKGFFPKLRKGVNELVSDCPKVVPPTLSFPPPVILSFVSQLLFPVQPQNKWNSRNAMRRVETFRVDNAKGKNIRLF